MPSQARLVHAAPRQEYRGKITRLRPTFTSPTITWIAVRVRWNPAPDNESARKTWKQRRNGISASKRSAGTAAMYCLPKRLGNTGAKSQTLVDIAAPYKDDL